MEDRTLAQRHDTRSWWGNPIEWTGYYLFGVGVYGTTFRSTTRYFALWGVVPLEWVYLTLLAVGASLLLLYSPNSPFCLNAPPKSHSRLGRLWLGFRGVVCLGLLVLLVTLAVRT